MGDPRVSRAAAVLVLAAGGEIRVPMRMINNAHLIRLHQSEDPRTGDVIYTATPYDRSAAGGTIIEAKAGQPPMPMKRISGKPPPSRDD